MTGQADTQDRMAFSGEVLAKVGHLLGCAGPPMYEQDANSCITPIQERFSPQLDLAHNLRNEIEARGRLACGFMQTIMQ